MRPLKLPLQMLVTPVMYQLTHSSADAGGDCIGKAHFPKDGYKTFQQIGWLTLMVTNNLNRSVFKDT